MYHVILPAPRKHRPHRKTSLLKLQRRPAKSARPVHIHSFTSKTNPTCLPSVAHSEGEVDAAVIEADGAAEAEELMAEVRGAKQSGLRRRIFWI